VIRQFAVSFGLAIAVGIPLLILIVRSDSSTPATQAHEMTVHPNNQQQEIASASDDSKEVASAMGPAGSLPIRATQDRVVSRSHTSATPLVQMQPDIEASAIETTPLGSNSGSYPPRFAVAGLGPATSADLIAHLMGTQPEMPPPLPNALQNMPDESNAVNQPVIPGTEPSQPRPPYPYTVAQEWYRYWYGWAAFNQAQLQQQTQLTGR